MCEALGGDGRSPRTGLASSTESSSDAPSGQGSWLGLHPNPEPSPPLPAAPAGAAGRSGVKPDRRSDTVDAGDVLVLAATHPNPTLFSP